jgi:hypothetical protein
MPSKSPQPKKRAPAFIPQVILHLETHDKYTCAFNELPISYQKQPYNVPAKILARGDIHTKVVMNQSTNTFILIKQ